jgi:hypothetical protein
MDASEDLRSERQQILDSWIAKCRKDAASERFKLN